MKLKLIAGLAVLALAMAPAKPIELQFHLKSGKVYSQVTEQKSTITQTIMGQAQKIETTANVATSLELKSSADDGDTYTIWYENMSMGMSGMGMSQTFSSDTSGMEMVNPMSKLLSGMTNEKFEAVLNRQGEVKTVNGLEEIITAQTGSIAGASGMSDQISESFGDGGLAKNIEMVTAFSPGKPVKIGDSWTKDQYTSTGLPLIAQNTYTLKSVDAGKAIIDVKSTMAVDPENKSMDLQGMKATYYLNGTRSGSMEIEVETGWVLSAKFTDDIAGSLTTAPSEQMPESMVIPIEMAATITITGK